MSLPWLRLYTEIIEDPKTGTLSDAEFRSYIELLCLARMHGDTGETGLTGDQINWKLRRNVSETFQELLHRNLIAEDGQKNIVVTAFEKRQMKSDSSTERVRKYRERQEKRNSNADVTLQKRPKKKIESKNKIKTSTSENKFSDDDLDLARWMYNEICKPDVAPKAPPPNIQKWADVIRLMRERDGHTRKEIFELFNWANAHHFWKTNILSPQKLREQFAKLDAQRRNSNAERNTTHSKRDRQQAIIDATFGEG